MFRLKLVPDDTSIKFVALRFFSYALSGSLLIAALTLFLTQGLNFGIDFRGGLLFEIGLSKPANLDELRSDLSSLHLGDVSLQQFGKPTDILIRVEEQPGGDEGQRLAQERVKDMLRSKFATPFKVPAGTDVPAMTQKQVQDMVGTDVYDVQGSDVWTGVSFRRIEVVGPKVSGELINAGIEAVLFAVAAVLVYIWLRFEWQFGVAAVVALIHDVLLTIGFFSLTRLEFNLSIIAALLTIVGYSLNDTVVVFDRVRENLQRYRRMPLPELFDKAMNETLSRTTMTSFTTLIALIALYLFGGEVIRGFTAAMIWGIFVGTYSSIFIAVPFLLLLKLNREHMVPQES